jgi:hypothetical protein
VTGAACQFGVVSTRFENGDFAVFLRGLHLRRRR